jgi:AraC-like DNA-binding protein
MQCTFKEITIEWTLGELYRIDDSKTSLQRQLGAHAIERIIRDKHLPWPQNCRILIAESNNELREYLSALFSFRAVIHAINDNLELYEAALEYQPDIIITDANVERDYSSISACRHSSRISHIPIFMLSNIENEHDKINALAAGCADVIYKPFNADELICKIANTLLVAKSLIQKTIDSQINKHLYIDSKALDNVFIKKLEKIIEENFKKPDFCSENLAEFMNVSIRQLQRMMLKSGLGTPSRHINVVRTHHAYKRLSEGSTIQQVVYESGFRSTIQFTRHFKKLYNMNPSDISAII